MTTAQVVETSVTFNNNSPIHDYVHPDDHTQAIFEMTPGFKPFTNLHVQNITTNQTEFYTYSYFHVLKPINERTHGPN